MIFKVAIATLFVVAAGCHTATRTICRRPIDAAVGRRIVASWQTVTPDNLNEFVGSSAMRADTVATSTQYVTIQLPPGEAEQCVCCDLFTFESGAPEQLLSMIMVRQFLAKSDAVSAADAIWGELTYGDSIVTQMSANALTEQGALFSADAPAGVNGSHSLHLSIEYAATGYLVRIHVARRIGISREASREGVARRTRRAIFD